ncbi:hypothetical protein [Rickettsia endosymbiont of Urophora cardui]|uniref:hypothetical protein n=1 Tax=Rickettsia endosymbiont of Urophora cardui TaxID=3066265 RepID=UPI00313BEB7C
MSKYKNYGKNLFALAIHGNQDKEFSCIAMDSTGIQAYTGNEWLESLSAKNTSNPDHL